MSRSQIQGMLPLAIMHITFKYRLKGKRCARQLCRYAVIINQVWNFCVQTQRKVQRNWREGLAPRWLSKIDLKNLTQGISKEIRLHAQSIYGVCDQFLTSLSTHNKCPKFRKSSAPRRSLGWIPFQQQSRQITQASITYLGNEYRFFGAKRRPLPPTAEGGCFVEDARGRWWVCFHVEVDNLPAAPNTPVGIDLGLKTLATLSTGVKIDAPRTYRLWEDKLIVAQRAGNKKRVKAIHEKIANIRRDHMHKWTTHIAKSYNQIFIGDVSSSRLAKTNMAKSVLDAGWYASKQALDYKARRRQGIFEEVSERFTTQTCSACGMTPESSPKGIAGLGIREWVCSECGTSHDRDVNSAQNILNLGLSAEPPVEGSRVAYGPLTG
jgi:putative transposase